MPDFIFHIGVSVAYREKMNILYNIFSGYMAGKHHYEKSGGSDTICLPSNPSWSNYSDGLNGNKARVYGTEFNEEDGLFPYSVQNQDLPCSVCLARKNTYIMIPGRDDCFERWTREYHGYLAAGYHAHASPIKHICVDFEPNFLPRGSANDDGHLLFLVEAICGSLPCPPYVHGRELACVVCTLWQSMCVYTKWFLSR